MTPTTLPGFLLVSEAAARAKCSPFTIRKEIREGRLRAVRIGRLVRILDEDLTTWARGPRSGEVAVMPLPEVGCAG
jgi:excisionase family DNA binding protein